jgi:penicillin-binding protein 2
VIEPTDGGRRAPVSPQMAMRVAVLGGIALALFAVLFFRLWFLQVLSGDRYVAQANNNRVRVERVPAPRGEIVDRNGVTLVSNRSANLVTLRPDTLPDEVLEQAATYGQRVGQRALKPKAQRGRPVPFPALTDPELRARYARLGKVIKLSTTQIHRRVITGLVRAPYAGIRLKTDVPEAVRNFLVERAEEFPGVDADVRFVREYPYGTLAAQLFGPVGEVSPEQLEQEKFRGVLQGAVVGKDGLELQYDQFLRGRDGTNRVIVGADNKPREVRPGRRPQAGRQLRLSLDLGLQQTLQRALRNYAGSKFGAALAMDPRTGEVLAMASLPTFDPSILSRPLTPETQARLFSDEGGGPLNNRAVAGLYPIGSTFKPITALAALDEGLESPTSIVQDTGCIQIGKLESDKRCNAGRKVYGPVDLAKALGVSSDIYFYEQGLNLNARSGRPLQTWARRLGFERRTGIDLPLEAKGVVPDAEWRARLNEEQEACVRREGRGNCFISDGREWTAGDNVGLAIGQGDLLATPLQLAVSYAGIATGRVPRPRLGLSVRDDQGRILQDLRPAPGRRVGVEPAWRDAILSGLRAAVAEPGGTATPIFKGAGWDFGRFPVVGKTGTAQKGRRGFETDSSWFVAYGSAAGGPEPAKEIVMVATIEEGGFGSETAAPVVCQAMFKWFTGRSKRCDPQVVDGAVE